MGIVYNLKKNYLEFPYSEPDDISNYILNHLIFEVFKAGKRDKLKEEFSNIEELNSNNFIEKLNELDASYGYKADMTKDFNNRRFPYLRNSGKFGLNTSLENMQDNLKKLVDIVMKSNVALKNKKDIKYDNSMEIICDKDIRLTSNGDMGITCNNNVEVRDNNNSEDCILDKYKKKDYLCNICNINKTTELDITFKERADSKYSFLFRGAEKSGFRNNGNSEGNICFECDFLNLMCLLYINLERPMALAYTNDLTELLFVNYKLMLQRKLYSDEAFLMKLLHERIRTLSIYDFDIDTHNGIILRFNSIVDYKNLLKRIQLVEIVDNYNFSRESSKMKNISKVMIKNQAFIALKDFIVNNLIVLKSEGTSREIDTRSSLYNITSYIKLLWIIEGKGVDEMVKYREMNYVYSHAGKELASEMKDNKRKKNFAFKVVQLLRCNDKNRLFQTIMHTLASYGVSIDSGFVEGIMQADELDLNTNIGLFVQELM